MDNSAIIDRIFALLKDLNLTNAQFAEAVDIPRSTLSHLQSGRNKPSLELIDKIVQKYPNRVSIDYLVYGNKMDIDQQNSTSEPRLVNSENTESSEIIVFDHKNGTFQKYKPV